MKKLQVLFFLTLMSSSIYFGCTPKTSPPISTEDPPVQDTVKKETPVAEDLSPCKNFDNCGNTEDAVSAHVVYKQFLKAKDYEQAYPYWQTAFDLAPAADGKRKSHFTDGVKFYEYFITQTTDQALKEKYVDTIFQLYDKMLGCFPNEEDYVKGLKAFDLYYKHKDRATEDEVFTLFREILDSKKEKTDYFVINPFTAMLKDRFFEDKISMEETQTYASTINEAIEYGYDSGKNRASWDVINNYAPFVLELFESEKGFYDCNYYKEKYFIGFDVAAADCSELRDMIGRLKWGGCSDEGAAIQELFLKYNSECREVSTAPTPCREGITQLENGEYRSAAESLNACAEEMTDDEKKAKTYMLIAKIYYGHLKNFPKARQYARKAAKLSPNWGEPWLLIGTLYASSGPLCGPGTGWDSQIVVWPAVDKWKYARSIDPSVGQKATQYINTYSKYMPTKGDVFQRLLKVGDDFKVDCWIQETTKIRTSD